VETFSRSHEHSHKRAARFKAQNSMDLVQNKYSNETSVKDFREKSRQLTQCAGRCARNRNATGNICVEMVFRKTLKISKQTTASNDWSEPNVILDGDKQFCCTQKVLQMQRFQHGSANTPTSEYIYIYIYKIKFLDKVQQASPGHLISRWIESLRRLRPCTAESLPVGTSKKRICRDHLPRNVKIFHTVSRDAIRMLFEKLNQVCNFNTSPKFSMS
jgi:hypothetical protein